MKRRMGVVISPFLTRWMRSKKAIEEHFQMGWLSPGEAEVYVPNMADTLCHLCSQWGNSEFQCRKGAPVCANCAGNYRTERHKCEVATYGRIGKVCAHPAIKCTNCVANHRA